jgi:hypothetical protein
VLGDGGRTLRIVSRGKTRAAIDTRTFTAAPAVQEGTFAPSWRLAAGTAAAVLLAAAAALGVLAARHRSGDARSGDSRSA